jgi:DNA-binding transcriptional ArsR family regulator
MSVQDTQAVAGLSRDEVFGLLANPRRRRVLHYLRHHGGTATLSEMASRIAAWETGVDVDGLSAGDRKSVYTSLQQTHLGRLDDAGVVEVDRDRGHVRATPAVEQLEVYLEIVPGRELPWREYYLALGAVSTALAIVAWGDVGAFAAVPDGALAGLVAGVLTLSAAVHVALERGNRIGAQELSPLDRE